MNVLVLTRYGRLGASSRLRFLQYRSQLESAGVLCTVQVLIDDEMLRSKYSWGSYCPGQLLWAYAQRMLQLLRRRHFDLLWIEKEALPWMPAGLERRLLHSVPYVLDYDDAIFHNYDLHSSSWIRLNPGDYQLELRRAGYKSIRKKIKIQAGEKRDLGSFSLELEGAR